MGPALLLINPVERLYHFRKCLKKIGTLSGISFKSSSKPCAPMPATFSPTPPAPCSAPRLIANWGVLAGLPGAAASQKPSGPFCTCGDREPRARSLCALHCAFLSVVIVVGVTAKELGCRSTLQACTMPAICLPNERHS